MLTRSASASEARLFGPSRLALRLSEAMCVSCSTWLGVGVGVGLLLGLGLGLGLVLRLGLGLGLGLVLGLGLGLGLGLVLGLGLGLDVSRAAPHRALRTPGRRCGSEWCGCGAGVVVEGGDSHAGRLACSSWQRRG